MATDAPANMALLERLDWAAVDAEVRNQQRNREVYTPVISLYRWWARRPHALIGALLDAASADEPMSCSDPFSGGGTVAVEAARRGLDTYAQDLHPWATTGLSVALDSSDPARIELEAARWLQALAPVRSELYGRSCPRHHGPSETLHTFWVRVAACPACARERYLYPYSLFTLASRRKDESRAYFGCPACGGVTRSSLDTHDRRCSRCRRQLPPVRQHLLADRRALCANTACSHQFDAFAQPPRWEVVLVQRLCGGQIHFDRPDRADIAQANSPPASLPDPLTEEIPDGVETRVVRRGGIRHWADLYPPRQLAAMTAADAALQDMKMPPVVKKRLRLALCGSAEMAGWGSRWDRWYPKAFETLANHRYTLTGLSVETNLLADRGRGTLPKRLTHSVKASAWTRENGVGNARQVSAAGERRDPAGLIALGSSRRQLPADDTIDLVLTDPPYFDDVQYAELAALFLAWARALRLIPDSVQLDLASEVVANTSRGVGADEYRRLLSAVLRETRRTLRSTGRMVLTFHNSDPRAWCALAHALGESDFTVATLAVARTENETDHAKRGRRSFTRDLVLECIPDSSRLVPAVTAVRPVEAETAELLAAGAAVASGATTIDAFSVQFKAAYGEGKARHIRMQGGATA